ncbi:MAG: hypothetical protein NC094_07565 [Bacteroidales bacterium]|nr:hypothetical protein [Lachnoclostridium sp.]MCM1384729.1 hypothetical protein [Lachnoclostridium sp.]MCM1465257.1 hypothetical protein [Bacteroidales bacterium]
MKEDKSIARKNVVIALACFLPFCGLSYILSKILTDPVEYFLLGFCWILVMSSYVTIKTHILRCANTFKAIIIMGYFIRLLIAFWGTYGKGAVINFLNTGDQIGFLNTAKQYYYGDFSQYYTRYPYVLLGIFKITGCNRMMPQLFNILCWYLGILVLEKIGDGFRGKRELLLLFFYVFMPWPLLISTQLYRESLMSLLMMLSYYYLWKWMARGGSASICSIQC